MTNKQNPIWRLLLLVMTGTLLGLSIYNWNAKVVLGNPMPMPFGYGVSVVLSGSMEPTLSVNDLVVIRETKQVEADDVIVFQSGKTLVIHRVVEVQAQDVITQGDANNTPDAPVPLNWVKGKLVFVIPGVGGLVSVLQKPVVILILAAGAIVLMELSYRKEKEKDSQELDAIQQEIRQLLDEMKDDN